MIKEGDYVKFAREYRAVYGDEILYVGEKSITFGAGAHHPLFHVSGEPYITPGGTYAVRWYVNTGWFEKVDKPGPPPRDVHVIRYGNI